MFWCHRHLINSRENLSDEGGVIMDKPRCNDDDSQSQLLDDQNLGSLSDGDLADSFNSDEPSKIELTKQELCQLEMATQGLSNARCLELHSSMHFLVNSDACFTTLSFLNPLRMSHNLL